MSKSFLQYLLLFVLLVLFQVLVFNNLVLFNVAVCFVYIYLIIRLPLSLNTNWLLTIAFLTGFVVDVFSDTPGLNSLSSVILAILKRPVIFSYISRDDKTKGEVPCISTMGWAAYSKALLTMTAVFCFISFSIEYFNFANIGQILLMVASSTLYSFFVLIGVDCIVDSYNAKRL